ncbi:unnamed protein product [Closterium sp. NIES-64]|nr:unnamed protein product [Closterium sp. NIES-64]
MEGLMFKEWLERGRSKVTIPLGIEVGTNDPLLIPIELSSSSEVTEVSHVLGGAEGEAAEVEGVLQQEAAPVAERGAAEEEVQQPTPSPSLPPRRTTQGKRGAVRGGAKEGAAKERPKRAAHPRDFLKYERLGGPKALLVQEEEDDEKGAEGEMEQIFLQEEFRRKELTTAAGEGGGSAYSMRGFKGRGSKKGKAKEGSGGEQHSGCKRCGGKCWYCHVEGHPWFKYRKLPDGWRPGQPSIEGSKGVHGAMGEGMGSDEGDGGAGGYGGMFYHVGEACPEDIVVPASKIDLHRSSHWVIDTGAFMTMTN